MSKPKSKKSTFKRMTTLQALPDDILFYIIDFINPRCSQERINILFEIIVPHFSFLTKHFKKRKNDCAIEDHFYFENRMYCMHSIPTLADDSALHKHYFHTILKDIVNDNRMKVRKKSLESAYTYHFPGEMTFEKTHPVVKYISSEILSKTPYKFSHMCCSGKGIFASVLS